LSVGVVLSSVRLEFLAHQGAHLGFQILEGALGLGLEIANRSREFGQVTHRFALA
jgi:hypothetical protein